MSPIGDGPIGDTIWGDVGGEETTPAAVSSFIVMLLMESQDVWEAV